MASMVKSVEFVEITQTGTTSNINLTKNQNYNDCVPFMTLHGCSDYMDSHCMDVWFSGTVASGIVNFQRNETRSCSMYIKCYVVEFDPAEVKVQQGSFSALPPAATTTYNTPSSFTQTKTAMVHYWWSSSGTRRWGIHMVRGRVSSNGTQVDMYRYLTGGTVTGHYFLFEDISAGNDHFAVNHQDSSYTGTSSRRAPSNPNQGYFDLSKTICIGSYTNSDNAADGWNNRQTARIWPYFAGLWQCDKNTAGGTTWYNTQFITFLDESKVYVVENRELGVGTPTLVGSVGTHLPCSLNTSCPIVTVPMGQCRGNTTSTTQIDSLWMSVKLTSTTAIQYERNSDGGGQASYTAYSVVDWAGTSPYTGTNPSPLNPDHTFVKSVENITMTIGAYMDMIVLSKGQDVSNCAVFVSVRGSGTGNQIRESKAVVWLREPGVLVGHCTDAGGSRIAEISVVEFYPDQVRVQSGQWLMWATTTTTPTISAVSGTSKAFILYSMECNEATYWSRSSIRARFTATDTIELYRHDAGNNLVGYYYVIEDLGDNFRVTHNTNSFTDTGHEWYTDNYGWYYSSMYLMSYAVSNDSYDVARGTARAYSYGSGGAPRINRQTSADTMYAASQNVRFLDMRYRTQVMAVNFDTSTTLSTHNVTTLWLGHEDALSAINIMQNDVGRGSGAGSDDMRGVFHTYKLINSNTQVENRREATVGITLYSSYGCAVNWLGYANPEADEDYNIPTGLNDTMSLVRSIEKREYNGAGRIIAHYMTKGQRPENCVPFASWRVSADDGEMTRIMRYHYVDTVNSKVISYSDSSKSGTGNLDETIYLVEFDPEQVKVQRLFKYMTGTSATITIPVPVVTNRTFIWFGYSVDNYQDDWNDALTTAEFTSSSLLTFRRHGSSGTVWLTVYLVECLQDQWYVKRVDTGSQTGTNFYDYGNFHYADSGNTHRFVQGSYSNDVTNYFPDRACLRLFPRPDHGFQWNRQTNSNSITDRHLEMVEFNPKIGVKVGGYWTDMSTGTTSETKSIVNDQPLDLDRAMVCPTIAGDINRVDATGANDVGSANVRFELTDDSTITCSRYDKGGTTYGWFQWVQWPAYKTHYFEGNVTEKGVPIIRDVACFRADTHELMDSTVSASGTGLYHLETTYSGAHYIICRDDDPPIDYNDLILGKMEPYPI